MCVTLSVCVSLCTLLCVLLVRMCTCVDVDCTQRVLLPWWNRNGPEVPVEA